MRSTCFMSETGANLVACGQVIASTSPKAVSPWRRVGTPGSARSGVTAERPARHHAQGCEGIVVVVVVPATGVEPVCPGGQSLLRGPCLTVPPHRRVHVRRRAAKAELVDA